MACAVSANVEQLIAARAVQGVGAALLVPGSLALISASFAQRERGRAIGTWAGFSGITAALGPVIGGYLVDHYSWAWAFLMAGKPLLSQRVTDVLAWCAAVRNHSDAAGLPVCVAATGKMTVPAQIAAALDKTIKAIYLHGGLVSFRHIVESERYEAAFANFVPGFLRVTDLPEIVASIAPRRVQMARMVDGSGRATTPQETGTHVAVKESAWNAASVADFLQNFA